MDSLPISVSASKVDVGSENTYLELNSWRAKNTSNEGSGNTATVDEHLME